MNDREKLIENEIECLIAVVQMHEKIIKSDQQVILTTIDEIKHRLSRMQNNYLESLE